MFYISLHKFKSYCDLRVYFWSEFTRMNIIFTILLTTFIIAATSCTSASIKTENPTPTASTSEVQNRSLTKTLRTDSVLQFSVMVTSIFEDNKGNYWFGTHGDGLCRYDGNTYTYFTAGRGLPMGIDREFAPGTDWDDVRKINGGNQAGSVQEDKEGNIWIRSSDNISKYNGQTFEIVTPTRERTLPTNLSELEWQEYLDYMWLSSIEGFGVYTYNGTELEHLLLPHKDETGRDGVSEIYTDSHGVMWFGTMANGIFRYDGKSFTRINNPNEQGISRSVFEDNSGRIWIPQNGLAMFYWENGELINFSDEYLEKYPKTSSEDLLTGGQDIEQDENGDIWFGSFGGGLYRYNGSTVSHMIPNGDIALKTAKTIYKDRSGQLWFGLGEGSVYGYDGESFYRFDSLNTSK